MHSTMKNANSSIEEPLALLAFFQNQPYRTVVCLRIDFDEIFLRFSHPEISLSTLSTSWGSAVPYEAGHCNSASCGYGIRR